MEHPANVIVEPCNHMYMCEGCTERQLSMEGDRNNQHCSMCRAHFNNIVPVVKKQV